MGLRAFSRELNPVAKRKRQPMSLAETGDDAPATRPKFQRVLLKISGEMCIFNRYIFNCDRSFCINQFIELHDYPDLGKK